MTPLLALFLCIGKVYSKRLAFLAVLRAKMPLFCALEKKMVFITDFGLFLTPFLMG